MDRLLAMEMLVRVVEAGSFSVAARQLDVGQPAVSKAIAQLEDHLGVRLLVRSTKGLTPTEAGQAFFERAKVAISEAEEAELAARGTNAALKGRLRVSMTISFARLHVIPQLQSFLDLHPEIEIDIAMDDSNVALIEEGIDVAIRMGRLADSTFTGRKIGQSRRIIAATKSYLSRKGTPIIPADLSDHEVFVISNGGDAAAYRFKKGIEEIEVSVKGRVRVNTGEGVRAATIAGLGLGAGTEWLFPKGHQEEDLIEVLADWHLTPLDIWAVFPAGKRVSSKARAFTDFVEQVLKRI